MKSNWPYYDGPSDREITFGLVMGGVMQVLAFGALAWCLYRIGTRQ